MSASFDLVLDARAALGECPLWVERDAALWFTDIKGKALHRFDPRTGAHGTVALPEEIGCFAARTGGGFVAATRSGIWRLDDGGGFAEKLADNPEDTAASRFNDGRTDPRGRLVAGTIDEPKAGGKASLYRFDRNGLSAPLMTGLTTSNGLAFSPDGRTMYHADTPSFAVYAHDYDPATGAFENRRLFIRFDETAADRGRPDGAAVDAEGCYWIALYEGSRVERYDPDGRRISVHPVPARCPTMPAFGGDGLSTLFVTSARSGRPEAEFGTFPHAGGLFALDAGVRGRADPLFDPAA